MNSESGHSMATAALASSIRLAWTMALATVLLVLSTGDGRAATAPPFAIGFAVTGNGNSLTLFSAKTNTTGGATIAVSQVSFIESSPDGALVYASSYNLGTVTVIESLSQEVLSTIPVAGGPTLVAVSPNGAVAYVTVQSPKSIAVIETASNTVVATILLDYYPTGIAFSPDSAVAYVTGVAPPAGSDPVTGVFATINTATSTVAATTLFPGTTFGRIAVTPDGAFAYVASPSSNSAYVIDIAGNTVGSTGSLCGSPTFVAITPNGKLAYVTCVGNDTVAVINTATRTRFKTLYAGVSPRNIAVSPNGAYAYVASGSGIAVISTVTNDITTFIPIVTQNISVRRPGNWDADGDGVPDDSDNCPVTANSGQSDIDGDGPGDLCDTCPASAQNICSIDGSAATEVPAGEAGVVATPDGNLSIDVQPGDVSSDTTFSVTKSTEADANVILGIGTIPDAGLALATYELGPTGQQFDSPVTLTIQADVTALDPTQRTTVDLYRLEDTNGDGVEDAFVPLTATCNVVEDPVGTFTAYCQVELSHFSTYAMVAPLDTDGDGIFDSFRGQKDYCATQNATGFDVDNNGCIDSFSGLTDLVHKLVVESVVATEMESSLTSKVNSANASATKDNICAAVNQLVAFKQQVGGQIGKKISLEAADKVTRYADSVSAYQRSKLSTGTTCN